MFNKKLKKLAVLSAIAVTGIFALAGCNSSDEDTLVLGTSADYPPFEFMDKEQNILGFDIMIAEEIAKDMGKELEIRNMEFNSLLTALQTDKVDMVLSGMNPNEERRKNVDFSDIYYLSKHYVVINSSDESEIQEESDLEGKIIGVQLGTTQEKIAREKFPNAKLVALGSIQDIMLQLKTEKLDAVITEDAVATAYVNTDSDFVLPGIDYEDEEGGIAVAVKKDSPDLVEAINETIERLKEEGKIEEFFNEAVRLSDEQRN
jgi:arginine/lysine/histidine transporter system substrate-binding protein